MRYVLVGVIYLVTVCVWNTSQCKEPEQIRRAQKSCNYANTHDIKLNILNCIHAFYTAWILLIAHTYSWIKLLHHPHQLARPPRQRKGLILSPPLIVGVRRKGMIYDEWLVKDVPFLGPKWLFPGPSSFPRSLPSWWLAPHRHDCLFFLFASCFAGPINKIFQTYNLILFSMPASLRL